MPLRKPVAGYPSQTDAVMALEGQGLNNAEIARRLGMTANQVLATKTAGRRVAARRAELGPNGRTIALPVETMQRLHPHAERRGLHVNAFVRTLLDRVVADDLVNAVLDDGTSV